MQRISYCNRRFVPHHQAFMVHIEDRGYQFADGVYEVIHAHHGVLVDGAAHFDRLEYSLSELGMAYPVSSRAALVSLVYEVMRRNKLDVGAVYIQITRGVAKREFYFPKKPLRPSLVITVQKTQPPSEALVKAGVAVITRPDARWKRCDIKSIALLAPVLAKQAAASVGAYETWQVDESGFITEGASTNAWMINGITLQTRPATHAILNGITRQRLMERAKGLGLSVLEKPFTPHDVLKADGAFLSSTTAYLLPLASLDGIAMRQSERVLALREDYAAFCRAAVR